MEPENRQVTTAPAAPTAGPTYRTLLLRLWLVRARLKARAGVRVAWPRDTADDRRLAAVLVAAGTAVITLLGCAVVGFTATTCVVLTAFGSNGALKNRGPEVSKMSPLQRVLAMQLGQISGADIRQLETTYHFGLPAAS